jgi:hypothetical protein
MPQLRVFAACQQVLVNLEDRSVSLISLLDTVRVEIPEGEALPFNMAIPFKWSGFALWHRQAEEEQKRFEQRLELLLPNGELAAYLEQTFQMPKERHRVFGVFDKLIVEQEGECLVKLLLREAGSEEEWQEISEYPITIEHVRVVPED